MRICKGVCLKIENYPHDQRSGKLPNESKFHPFCSTCQTVLKTESIKCPCCKSLLSWRRVELGKGEVKIVKL